LKRWRDLVEGTRSRPHHTLFVSKTVQDIEVGRRFRPKREHDLEVVRRDVVEVSPDVQFLHQVRWFLVQDVAVATLDLEER
jgi:hypothetical protein